MKNLFRLITALLLAASLVACGGGGSGGSSSSTSDTSGSSSVTALQITDNTVGTGAVAQAGDSITVTYTGWLYDSSAPNDEGTEFDSSADHNPNTFTFTLGAGQVIAGWDQGLVGMQVGGTRTLIIPSSMGYGASGSGSIPPNAALVFTVQLLSVTAPQ